MTEREIEKLCKCYKCGSRNVTMLMNARRQFQVRCQNCGTRTKWNRKTDAVVEWFNSYISAMK